MYDVQSILSEQEVLIKRYKSLSSILRALYLEKTVRKLGEARVIKIATKLKREMAEINEQIYLFNQTLKFQGDL